ncbi:Gfo/Idh/MocA family oxidoreductase [Bremerella sp. JC770]|uniref:Gfo/Idh/MocA family protein n=1 Tax=Bremerella sp. JC770 TaxID=3232137 RepID=UPI00345AF6A1
MNTKVMHGPDVPTRHKIVGRKVVNVAIVGCGYWGKNLVRNFAQCPHADPLILCDEDESKMEAVSGFAPQARKVRDFEEVLMDDSIDAVAIATPISTHAQLALAAMNAGKHVLVEKPMAGSVQDAEEMVQTANREGLVLMVDHTFVFSSPVIKMKQLYDSGELGTLNYIDCVRINLGLIQHDANVVWDLAPHDLSIIDYLIGRTPRVLSAFGAGHTSQLDIEDVAYLNLDYGEGLLASCHVNWLSPVKVRSIIFGGTEKSVIFDDINPSEKLRVFDRSVEMEQSDTSEARKKALVNYRMGDVVIPNLEQFEPLQRMVSHFATSILNGSRPITDGEMGLRVVQVLEAAQRSIKAQGSRIML